MGRTSLVYNGVKAILVLAKLILALTPLESNVVQVELPHEPVVGSNSDQLLYHRLIHLAG